MHRKPALTVFLAILVVRITPHTLQAATWNITAGAESSDLGRQAAAFLPNELWIHAGDSILWAVTSHDTHTISFLTAGPLRPTVAHDSDVVTPSGSSFDGSSFVNSGELPFGQTYTVKFPAAGNFKLVCLAHVYMNGIVHVLKPSDALPYNQAFYDRQAIDERNHLLAETGHRGDDDDEQRGRVMAGTGEILANGAGYQTAAAVRFFPETITVHTGQTVEWTNFDPMTIHNVTFDGSDAPGQRGLNADLDTDGALHAIVGSPTDNVSSGSLRALPADRAVGGNPGLPVAFKDLMQWPLPAVVADINPRFRVTFTHPGVYNYRCVFHDNLGMLGRVIVLP
jgi:plastocyanin